MKRLTLALALMLCVADSVQAVTISIVGDGRFGAPNGTTGQLEVHVFTGDDFPRPTFSNGGIELRVDACELGVLEFTGATVRNPSVYGFSNRWSVAQAQGVTPHSISLLQGASVNTPALSSGDPSNTIGPNLFLFATIDYRITGYGGIHIELSGADGTNDFISSGVQFVPTLVGGTNHIPCPEPTSLGLACLSLIGLISHRSQLFLESSSS